MRQRLPAQQGAGRWNGGGPIVERGSWHTLQTLGRGGLPEIAGDAALYVDPSDIGGFAAALKRLVADVGLRRDLQARGRARAEAQFAIATATARLDALRAGLLVEG